MSLRGGPRHAIEAAPVQARSKPVSLGLELGFTLLLVLVVAFVLKTFLIQSFYIPSESMEPTLQRDDRVIVSKLAPGPLNVHRGDVIVFHDPGGWSTGEATLPDSTGLSAWLHGVAQSLGLAPATSEEFLIKRIIGLPGDVVACEGSGAPVTVNGVAIDESPYLMPGVNPSDVAFEVQVPAGAVWVMGDNRANSYDSRYHQDQELRGALALDQVVGVSKIRLWPLNRFQIMKIPAVVFADVPAPPAGF